MNLKVIEWNIHGAASMGWNNNYTIQEFVVNRIIDADEKADIIILVEFVVAKGWDYLQSKFEENNYIWFMTYISSQNGILIAIKKHIEGLNLEEIKKCEGDKISTTMNTGIAEKPDFIQVELKVEEKQPIFIIGTRIRVDSGKNTDDDKKVALKRNQFKELDAYLSKIGSGQVICAGDFNAYWPSIWKTKKNTTLPKTSQTYDLHTQWDLAKKQFSYVLPIGTKCTFDHIISRGVAVSNIEYNWDFVSISNGYDNLKAEDYKSHLIGLPDHAILIADIEL